MRPLFSVFNVASLLLLGLAALALRLVQQPPPTPTPPSLRLAEKRQLPVTLYFSDSQVQRYVRQKRELSVTQSDPLAAAQAVVAAWAAGPAAGGGAVAVVPARAPVPRVWLRGDHFVVNLPASYAGLNYGTSGEHMLLCSLTRTLLEQRGKDVTFLLSGRNVQTLLGHADLRTPYTREDCPDE